MNASDRKLIEEMIDAAVAPCPSCSRARADKKRTERARGRESMLSLAPEARLDALRAMTFAARVEALNVDLTKAIELLRDARPDDQRMVLSALPPAVAGNAVVWTLPLIRWYRVRNVGIRMTVLDTFTGLSEPRLDPLKGTTAARPITVAQYDRLVAAGYKSWTRRGQPVLDADGWVFKGWAYDAGTDSNRTVPERYWILSEQQLAILIEVDPELRSAVEAGHLVPEPLDERACRALMRG